VTEELDKALEALRCALTYSTTAHSLAFDVVQNRKTTKVAKSMIAGSLITIRQLAYDVIKASQENHNG
jgi:hypothetical protein